MAQTTDHSILCPKCKAAQTVTLHDSLRVSIEPELRDALMANELNKINCSCGHAFRVDKNFLYHDDRHGAMIYLVHARVDDADAVEKGFLSTIQSLNKALPAGVKPPRVLLVLNRTELVERIFLVEAGLDERVIEYIKYTIYTRNLKNIPFTTKVLLFDAQGSTGDNLHFVVQDAASHRLESVVQFKRDTYQAVSDAFNQDDKTGQLLELFPGPYISARRTLLAQDKK